MRIFRFTAAALLGLCCVPAQAETFDFQGSAVVDCTCPTATMEDNCGLAGRKAMKYSLVIAVRPGLSADLAEACFRKRDRDLCCEAPRASYKGVVAERRPKK